MGAHGTLKECQLVIKHFNNTKLPTEIDEIIHRSHPTVQHIVKRYK
jgi:hypothetical protein